MENLAYLHLFCAYEASDEPELTFHLDLGKFSSQTSLFALKVLVPLGILLSAGSALALQRGDSGAAVTDLQEDLRAAGFFNQEATGFFGSITEESVKDFQRSKGLSADGIAGSETLQALRDCANGASIQPVSFSNGGLRLGSRGAEVSEIQRLLNANDYTVSVDGVFGSETDRAVRRFQTANSLLDDGIVGSATRDALESGARVSRTNDRVRPVAADRPVVESVQPTVNGRGVLRRGDSGEDVRRLQEQLRDANFYDGPITGFFGSQTEDAVVRFQRANRLDDDGVAGPQTLARLNPRDNQTANRYVVVIPTTSGATTQDVRRYVRDAYVRNHPRGTFIQAGAYTSRQPAEDRSRNLRQVGFDSRVEYF
jgi:peptidoglycan hydrolase-like protein with peptidoglycan-binding domain